MKIKIKDVTIEQHERYCKNRKGLTKKCINCGFSEFCDTLNPAIYRFLSNEAKVENITFGQLKMYCRFCSSCIDCHYIGDSTSIGGIGCGAIFPCEWSISLMNKEIEIDEIKPEGGIIKDGTLVYIKENNTEMFIPLEGREPVEFRSNIALMIKCGDCKDYGLHDRQQMVCLNNKVNESYNENEPGDSLITFHPNPEFGCIHGERK